MQKKKKIQRKIELGVRRTPWRRKERERGRGRKSSGSETRGRSKSSSPLLESRGGIFSRKLGFGATTHARRQALTANGGREEKEEEVERDWKKKRRKKFALVLFSPDLRKLALRLSLPSGSIRFLSALFISQSFFHFQKHRCRRSTNSRCAR